MQLRLEHGYALFFAIAGAGVAALAQIRLHRIVEESEAHKAIVLVVHAYLLLMSAIAAAGKPEWGPALVAFYLAFAIAMTRRPVKQQI